MGSDHKREFLEEFLSPDYLRFLYFSNFCDVFLFNHIFELVFFCFSIVTDLAPSFLNDSIDFILEYEASKMVLRLSFSFRSICKIHLNFLYCF